MKAERDTLIDDLPVLRASNVRLQRENGRLRNDKNELTKENNALFNINMEGE